MLCIIGRGIRKLMRVMSFVVFNFISKVFVEMLVVIIWGMVSILFGVIVVVVIDFIGCIGNGVLNIRFVIV